MVLQRKTTSPSGSLFLGIHARGAGVLGGAGEVRAGVFQLLVGVKSGSLSDDLEGLSVSEAVGRAHLRGPLPDPLGNTVGILAYLALVAEERLDLSLHEL